MKIVKFAFIIICLLIIGCKGQDRNILIKDAAYPRWLAGGSDDAKQTSGIAFIGVKEKKRNFLIADDIGAIHRLEISADTVIKIYPVKFSEDFKNYLKDFPKKDFEEITYDKYTGSIYLSIEGNNPDPKKFTKILKLNFACNSIYSDSIVSFEEIQFEPQELFTRYIQNNVAYEGLTVDEHYFYLGLEGFSDGPLFADSTFIFIADKKTKKIIKSVSTKELKIGTVCGLCSVGNGKIFGVDRNSKNLFYIDFNDNLEVAKYAIFSIKSSIPNYRDLDYVCALESVSLDEEKNVYLIDDPWMHFYVPTSETFNKLDKTTQENFKNFIPIIYRFKYPQNL